MALFRGTGGSGDASTDTYASEVALEATRASTKANEAAASATSAATSEAAAQASYLSALGSQIQAGLFKQQAETSESNASSFATQAGNSAQTAVQAKIDAESAKTSAETAETNAETAETNAETAETNAAASATTATTKASEASTSASNASTSESNAASSASSASTSATNAATSATAAQTAQTAAEAAKEAIDGLYLGTASSNPTVDGNGDAVTVGDWYFNTSDNTTRIYDGSGWNTINPDLVGDTSPQLGGNLASNGNDVLFADNDKAIFGTGSDLEIYHDGSSSYIKDSGTGSLSLETDGVSINLMGSSGSAFLGRFVSGGGAVLYYNNATKLNTTSSGVSVTGDFSVSGTVDGRDIATDGAKLDNIEASADVTDTTNVTAAGALMDSEVTNLSQVKAFDTTDYATAAQGAKADSALQSGDNISVLTNNSGYLTANQTITLSGAVTGSGTTSITTTLSTIDGGTY